MPLAKKLTNLMAHTYSHLYDLPKTRLRFFTVYGPREQPDMALFKFNKVILENKPIQVFNYGKHRRDFTYIADIVECVIRVLDKPAESADQPLNIKDYPPHLTSAPWRIFNVGNNNPVDLMDYIEIFEKHWEKTQKKISNPYNPVMSLTPKRMLRNW